MNLSVKHRGEFAATFRAVEVHSMEMLAAWVPTTPEMEVKLLFGEHIWDCAQHADALGKRTHELRLPLQHSLPPVPAYLAWLERLGSTAPTTQRVAGFYDGLLPSLGRRYRGYLALTDTLMDAPTVRIIERILADHGRMLSQRAEMLIERPDLALVAQAWLDNLVAVEAAIREIRCPAVEEAASGG